MCTPRGPRDAGTADYQRHITKAANGCAQGTGVKPVSCKLAKLMRIARHLEFERGECIDE